MMPKPPIDIVDDDPAVRDSLSTLLSAFGYDAREFENGELWLKTGLDNAQGPILLDVRMPGRDGLDILVEALKARPNINIIMMSGHGDIAMAVRAMRAGARDFVEKPFDTKALLASLEKLTANEHMLAYSQMPDGKTADPLSVLTPREREVVHYLVEGDPNKIIAHKMGISVRTVETHRAHVMQKLGAKSLSDVIRLALNLE